MVYNSMLNLYYFISEKYVLYILVQQQQSKYLQTDTYYWNKPTEN